MIRFSACSIQRPDQGLEECAVETAGSAVIDVLDRRLVAQPGKPQPCPQPTFIAVSGFAIEQQTKPFGVRELDALRVCLQLGKSARHAVEPELMKLINSGVGEQEAPPQW